MAKAARQVEKLAVQAVASCEPADAQPVWLLAFEKLAALGSSSKKLTQALLHHLTGMRQGPTRVRHPLLLLQPVIQSLLRQLLEVGRC